MSSCPGGKLEDFIMWNYNIKVIDRKDVNLSLQIAEAISTATKNRPIITDDNFKKLIEIFEGYRNEIEYALDEYDDEYSWRDYAGYAFDFISDKLYDAGLLYLKKYK